MVSINDLCKEAAETTASKGFDETDFMEKMMLVVSEISEAVEDFRQGRPVNKSYILLASSGSKPFGIPIELADACIRIFSFCGANGIDLQKAIEDKMAYNKTRPYRHGKIL